MTVTIDKQTLQKYDVPGPRYTSYPTAPTWSDEVNESVYRQKLKDFAKTDKTLSLYVHIPFCETMCVFCACSVVIRKADAKYSDEYLTYLFKEIDLVRSSIGKKARVRQLHWGGGTPNFLTIVQMEKLFQKILETFDVDLSGEIAIEIDPRTIDREKLKALRAIGFNRISMGIQDFNEDVQKSVNRVQPYALVENVYAYCRQLGFESINFDLIYGLPYQTADTFSQTVSKVIGLRPDRIALYSFAYLPWLKKHQTKIHETSLPSNDHKLDIFLNSRVQFLNGGYEAIAMDHFALKTDELAQSFQDENLYRNFMGYTVKPADEYLGLGVSAIGFLENTFVQNQKILPKYYESLREGYLPIERGKVMSQDDIIRQWTINSLMCHFKIDKQKFQDCFHVPFDEYFPKEQGHIRECIEDELLEENNHLLHVTEFGRIFIRNICMGFDQYLSENISTRKFSRTI